MALLAVASPRSRASRGAAMLGREAHGAGCTGSDARSRRTSLARCRTFGWLLGLLTGHATTRGTELSLRLLPGQLDRAKNALNIAKLLPPP